LLKYSLGGRARLSVAAQSGLSTVILDAELAGEVLTFEREMHANRVLVSKAG